MNPEVTCAGTHLSLGEKKIIKKKTLNQEQKVLIQIPTQSSYQGQTAHEMQQTAGLK